MTKRQQFEQAIQAFQPQSAILHPESRYTLLDYHSDDEIILTEASMDDLVEYARNLWNNEDMDDPSDSEIVHSKLDNLDVTFDEVNEILIGSGYIAELEETKA